MSEKFKLKWNDFQSNVSNSFGLLRNENYLHDVTLVSDDNLQISAHKLVLSACSDYFKNILKHSKHPHYHPLVCLSGVSSEDLNNIVDYMYNGEVQIHQEELDRFLNVAQRLKLNGLIGDNEVEGETKSDFREEENHSIVDAQFVARPEITESRKKNTLASFGGVGTIAMNSDEIVKIDEKIKEYIDRDDQGIYKCTYCGKIGDKFKSHMKNHIETHLEGLSFPCHLCDKTFRSKNSLFNHTHKILV